MELGTFTELISTLGFPVVLVLAMGWFIYKLWQQSVQREGKLYEELAECRQINSKAIETIASYVEKLENIQKDVTDIKEELTHLPHSN